MMKGKLKYSLFTSFLSVLLFISSAQEPFFTLKASFNDFEVNVICQDDYGFLWLGTTDGPYRFDGKNLSAIYADSVARREVVAVYPDSKGRIWFGHNSGMIRYLENGILKDFNPEAGLPKVPVTGIARSDSVLWFSTYGEGIYFYKNDRLYNLNTDDGLPDDYSYSVTVANNAVYTGTDGGFSRIRLENDEKVIDNFSTRDGLPDIIVTKVVRENSDHLLIGTQQGGICRFNTTINKVEHLTMEGNWGFGAVTGIITLDDVIWVSTEKSGLIEFSTETTKYHPVEIFSPEGQQVSRLKDILYCTEGNVWIPTAKELYFSTGTTLHYLDSTNGCQLKDIHAIATDSEGMIWFCSDRSLFSARINGSQLSVEKEYPDIASLKILSLYVDSSQTVWAGTFGDGLYQIEPYTGQVTRYTVADGLPNNNILFVAGAGDHLWFATLGGASRMFLPATKGDKVTFENFSDTTKIGDYYIYTVFEDSQGNVWFGTDGNGISKYYDGIITNYNNSNGLKSDIIYSVTEDSNGDIWCVTANAEVYRYDGTRFNKFKLNLDPEVTEISSMTSVGDKIILAHDLGLEVIDIQSGSVVRQGRGTGWNNRKPELNSVSAIGHQAWIGTNHGLVRYTVPDREIRVTPNIHINSTFLFLEPHNIIEDSKLAYDNNHISFDYSGIWLQDPDMLQYNLMLEGHDLDWTTSKNDFITYANLAPGKYTFKVKAVLDGQRADSEVAKIGFMIRKPYWNTIWFYLLLLVSLGVIFYLIIIMRERRLKRVQRLKRENLEFQLATFRNQVNPHFLFNSFSTLAGIIDDDRERAVDYVDRLSLFFRDVLEQRNKSLIRLDEELRLLDNYIFLQKQRFENNFEVNMSIPDEALSKFIPPMTLQLLVENAVKHNVVSNSKPLVVKVYPNEQDYLIVENKKQLRKNNVSSTGVGLQNIKSRYGLLTEREIKIISDEQIFSVAIPLIENTET